MFEEEIPEIQDSDVQVISDLIGDLLEIEENIVTLEEQLAELRDKHNELNRSVIPQRMQDVGITEITTTDGFKVQVVGGLAVSIPKNNKDGALQWLRDHGHDDIIKHDVGCSFKKGENDLANSAVSALEAAGFSPYDKETVHPSTLKAWARDRIEHGQALPEEYFNLFEYQELRIKTS